MENVANGANGSFVTYQKMVRETSKRIAALKKICGKLNMNDAQSALVELEKKMDSKTFNVGIMGEFKRGKSTVINALLGQEIVPADVIPTSATLNYIRYGSSPSAIVRFKDGTEKEIGVNELEAYVTKLTAEYASVAENVESSVVSYPCPFCQNDVQIIDTPGLNDDERMEKVATEVIPSLDAIIFVLVHGSPVSKTESDFLRTKIMTSDLGRIIFVVNQIDLVPKDKRERILSYMREVIETKVLDKIKTVTGEDSKLYDEAKSKMGNIRIMGVSALNALQGQLTPEGKQSELFKESNYEELEKALQYLLTVERGSIELIVPINTTLSVAHQTRALIAQRRLAMTKDAATREQYIKDAAAAAEKTRRENEKSIAEKKRRIENLKSELLPDIVCIYDNIKKDIDEYIDTVNIDSADVSDNSSVRRKTEELAKELNEDIEQRISAGAEAVSLKIQKAISTEMSNYGNEANNLFADLFTAQAILFTDEDGTISNTAVKDMLINMAACLGLGIAGNVGGALAGWKANGVGGAVVGGLSGLVAGYAAWFATIALVGPVAIPAIAVSGIVASFCGKKVVGAVFSKSIGERNVGKVRSNLKKHVELSLDKVKTERLLENWLNNAVQEASTFLSQTLDNESKRILEASMESMAQIKLDQQKGQAELEAENQKLELWEQELTEIVDALTPIKNELDKTLSQKTA